MPAGLILGMPASPLALLTTRLVPLSGRLRAALEPWVPRGGGEDESLHQFLCRRLGRSTAEAVAEPLLEAVHAGDARRLSARATYPQLVTLEERYGSLPGASRPSGLNERRIRKRHGMPSSSPFGRAWARCRSGPWKRCAGTPGCGCWRAAR